MKLIGSLFLICTALLLKTYGQQTSSDLKGEVSFVTSQNVYVKFERTSDIEIGDTLYLAESHSPCLQVSSKSSSSCVCKVISSCAIKKGDATYARIKQKIEEPTKIESPQVDIPKEVISELEEESDTNEPSMYTEKIRGRISVSNYSNIASKRDNRSRWMTRISLNADHINNSKLSIDAYLNYRQITPTKPEKFDPQTRFFRVYNLAATYDVTPDLSIVLGRKINPKIASLGAIDGLQVEQRLGKSYVGAIVGSRPDVSTYALNPNLIEYGGYVGASSHKKDFYSQTSLGVIEQRNTGKIDRRYAYFQHSSTIARNLSLFSSMEMDLYSAVNGTVSNKIRLPNLYVSGTYRFGRKVDWMVSYDARKRVLYYETLQTEIERLLNDDLTRQGVRTRITIKPIKHVRVGGSYSKRFQSDQQNSSDNIHAFANWSNIPKVGGRLSLTYNNNKSNYLTSNILSARHSRTLIKNKLDADFYYRRVGYVFVNSERIRMQNYFGSNLSIRFNKRWSFRLAGEVSHFNTETNYRIYARLITRLYKKRENK